MATLASYSTGTVSVTAGGTTVTGTGTIWSGVNARPGDILQIGNFQTIISDVVDTDTLTIPPWGGGAQTSVTYTIWQVSPQRFAGAQAMATVNQLVAAFETSGFTVFVKPAATEPDPSLGNDGQYADQPTTGKKWVKVGGVWTYLGIFKAFQLKGAWDGGTDYTVGDVVSLSGASYVCVLDHTNHTPPNATYWQLLAARGTDGDDGAAATVAVGTVTTGAGGSAAAVTNSGTSSAAVFDFTIPAGKSYGGTSTTSLAIGTGSKVFTTQSGLAYQDGARVRASSAANTSNWMEGLATYAGTTLTINVDKTNGSGTLADWNFNNVGQPGAGDLSSANNLSDLADAATARTNLGAAASATTVSGSGLATGGGNLSANRTITVTAATQSDMETATSTSVAVTPGVQKYHPAHPKAWVNAANTGGSILAAYGVSSITNVTANVADVNWSTPFSSANYCPISTVFHDAIANQTDQFTSVNQFNVRHECYTANTGAATSPTRHLVMALGDQ